MALKCLASNFQRVMSMRGAEDQQNGRFSFLFPDAWLLENIEGSLAMLLSDPVPQLAAHLLRPIVK